MGKCQSSLIKYGHLKGKHGGYLVYGVGGGICTLTATTYKHTPMILVKNNSHKRLFDDSKTIN